MTDSTAKVKIRVCKLESCNNTFVPVRNQRYCCKQHLLLNKKQIRKEMKLKQTVKPAKKIPKEVQEEMKRFTWQKGTLSKLNKFYELFGVDFVCDICGISFGGAMDEYGVPLFIQLNKGIRDHRVLDPDQWSRFCLKCWANINIYKKEEEENENEEI